MTVGNIALLPSQLFNLVAYFIMCKASPLSFSYMGKFDGWVTLLTRNMVESIILKKVSSKKSHGLYCCQKYCLAIFSHLEISHLNISHLKL
jgi:hypothetical protein